MSDHEITKSTGEAPQNGEAQEALSPLEQKIQASVISSIDTARALADRGMEGVRRHVVRHKDGTFSTEIYGLEFGVDPNTNAKSRLESGDWFADTMHVRYDSTEDGVPLGTGMTLTVDARNSKSLRFIDRAGSVDDGKPVYDDRSSVSFHLHAGRKPSTYSTVIRRGNSALDRQEYDKGASDVVRPVDQLLAQMHEKGANFVDSAPVKNDLVAQVAAERARKLLEEQESARAAVIQATAPPRFEEPAQWSKPPVPATADRPWTPPSSRDVTGYRQDEYTRGQSGVGAPVGAAARDAYAVYFDKPKFDRSKTTTPTKKSPIRDGLRNVGHRVKNRLKKK